MLIAIYMAAQAGLHHLFYHYNNGKSPNSSAKIIERNEDFLLGIDEPLIIQDAITKELLFTSR